MAAATLRVFPQERADRAAEALSVAQEAFEMFLRDLRGYVLDPDADHDDPTEPDANRQAPTFDQVGRWFWWLEVRRIDLDDLNERFRRVCVLLGDLAQIADIADYQAKRYYDDPAARAAMPCSECGAVGCCEHFPPERGDDG